MSPFSKSIHEMRQDITAIFNDGLNAVEPRAAIKKYCRRDNNHLNVGNRIYDLSRYKKIFVIGAGKASAPMGAAVEDILGERITKGYVNVKYEHVTPLHRINLIEAGHPLPDKNGQIGAEKIFHLTRNAAGDDLILCLISGGGSALLPLPAPGLTLQDKQDTTTLLLSCGASIHEINTIRKHTSMVKGGRLAQAAYPATLVSLILSDVVGDDLDVIASGTTVPDSTTFSDCVKIFSKYNINDRLPASVVDHVQSGVSGKIPENPTSDDICFENVQNLIVGSNMEAVTAAKKKAESLGYRALVLSSMLEGETRHVAHVHGAVAREIIQTGNPIPSPACIISGGETIVTITGSGSGGRNQEFALAAAIDIADKEKIVVLSAGTDGTDGPTDAAGAIADTTTLKRGEAMGMNLHQFLSNNDSYHFFERLGDLFITGPTNTNVMDLRIVLIT